MSNNRYSRLLFIIGILINLLQLIVLKYATFTINPLFEILNIDIDLSSLSRIVIPVGVSFFTLQSIGYLINVNFGWEKPEKNYFHLLLYLIFFPRFLSGPIDRSNLFLPQIRIEKEFNESQVIQGFKLLLFGLFKKIVIANQLAPVVLGTFENLHVASEQPFFIILLLLPLFLYFDFSGYTDIAIGIAKMFGYDLRPNFNRPFMSTNVTMFWKRFHISLSSWFHDYVFIRTVFRTKKWGKNASTVALFLTWTLFGIWHGAGWNFMLLGMLQAIAVYYEFSTRRLRTKVFERMPALLGIWLSRIVVYCFYSVSLVFFFAKDLQSVLIFFSNIGTNHYTIPIGINSGVYYFVLVLALILLFLEVVENDYEKVFQELRMKLLGSSLINRIMRWSLYIIILTLVIVFNREVQQFIYFQF